MKEHHYVALNVTSQSPPHTHTPTELLVIDQRSNQKVRLNLIENLKLVVHLAELGQFYKEGWHKYLLLIMKGFRHLLKLIGSTYQELVWLSCRLLQQNYYAKQFHDAWKSFVFFGRFLDKVFLASISQWLRCIIIYSYRIK